MSITENWILLRIFVNFVWCDYGIVILLKEVCFYLVETHKGVCKGEMICCLWFTLKTSEEKISQMLVTVEAG